MSELRRVRTSERTNFKKCRQLWEWTSAYGMNLEPVRMNQHLAFGIAIHRGLEVWYLNHEMTDLKMRRLRAVNAFVTECNKQMQIEADAEGGDLGQEREDEFYERIDLGKKMLNYYFSKAPRLDKGLKVVAVEVKGVVPIPGLEGAAYQSRLDLVVQAEDGTYWVMDHKTAGRKEEDMTFLTSDPQMISYVWAAEIFLGIKISGVIYNELFKRALEPPKTISNGKKLSKDKSQNTSYALYRKAIDEMGLNEADYFDFLEYLLEQDTVGDYIRRTQMHYDKEDIAGEIESIRLEVEDMTDPNLRIYPNRNKFNCGGCAFAVPCRLKWGGGDYEYVLKDDKYYRTRIRDQDEE